MKNSIFGTITLIGSGEMAESMSRVHRKALANLDGDVNAVFLDTPAGFELNAGEISAKAIEYFRRFSVNLDIVRFRNKERADAAEIATAVGKLRKANFIFAGPGSPSYAVRNWEGTSVWESVVDRWQEGAQLVFASAAAITTGVVALPVYEIYKAGEDPHWIPGVNLLQQIGLSIALVPHWNNSEGGTFDTRFCFMGAPRLEKLEAMLPESTMLLGIDEYTACILDPGSEEGQVMGAGSVTVRYGGRERIYAAGATIRFDELRAGGQTVGITPQPRLEAEGDPQTVALDAGGVSVETTNYLHELAHALRETHESERQRDLIEQAHDTMHELSAEWMTPHGGAVAADITPFVETLIDLRSKLRTAKQYALADEVRQRLVQAGIVLEDTTAGTRWKRTEL